MKTLTPSVVQIVTEIMAMGTINQPGPRMGVGTGVILDLQGNILTNNHVIAGAERITVTLNNGESFPAQVIGGDATTDTAVIRIEATGLQPAKLGRSSELQVGEEVIGIGHALGLPGGPTVSKGVVSALGRSIATGPQTTIVDLIQTDAAINPGNSGGPLANSRAEVIGINTAIIQGSRGIGFAINIDDVKIVIAQLLERGYVIRGFLGISPVTLPRALANLAGAPVTEGVLLAQVVPGSAADNAGLQEEDIIVRLDDEPIRNTGELSKFLIAHPPGETVTVVFFRGSEEKSAQVTLEERPRE
ncbi:MAG: trypsin-like peptidase domain-containing protein [Chloroflexi bacterium]|nr:trypsin-like peptidase domain-containing protein [Chloroflexota bacterium]